MRVLAHFSFMDAPAQRLRPREGGGTCAIFHITVPAVFEGVRVHGHFTIYEH